MPNIDLVSGLQHSALHVSQFTALFYIHTACLPALYKSTSSVSRVMRKLDICPCENKGAD